MSTQFRTSFGVAVAVTCLAIGTIHAQDLSEIAAATRDLRQTLRDLDARLAHLEKMVSQQAKERHKRRSTEPASAPIIRIDPAAQLMSGQDAYRRGRIEESGQQYEKAIELYSQAVRFDPGNDLAFLHRGMSHLRIGRLDEALADVNRSLAIQPNSAQAYAFRGSVYLATKTYDQALADFTEASHRDSGNAEYLLSKGGAEEERGNFKVAAEVYQAASTLQPESAPIYLKRAGALRQSNQPQMAAELCSVAIGLKPMGAEGYSCRAESYVQLGLLPNAVADLNQALHLQPTLPQIANLLPVVRQMIEVNDSMAKLTAVKNSISNEAPSVASTGCSPSTSTPAEPVIASRIEPAPAATPAPPVTPANQPSPISASNPATVSKPAPKEETKTLDPTGSRRLVRESRMDIEKGLFQPALDAVSTAIELDPTSAVAYNTRGYVYLRIRQYDLAIRDFSRAIDLNSAYANAYLNRGAARRLSGDAQGGKQDFENAARFSYATNATPSRH